MPKTPHFSRGLSMASSIDKYSVFGIPFSVKFMALTPEGTTSGGENSISYGAYLLDKLFLVKSRTVNDECGLKRHPYPQVKRPGGTGFQPVQGHR